MKKKTILPCNTCGANVSKCPFFQVNADFKEIAAIKNAKSIERKDTERLCLYNNTPLKSWDKECPRCKGEEK